MAERFAHHARRYIRDTIEVLISSAYLLSFITLWTGVERG
jgi:hypothetical protein